MTQEITKPSYEALEDFVRKIADRCCDPVMQVQAQMLLHLDIEDFNGEMVDDLVIQADWNDRNDQYDGLREEMEALVLKYGDKPLLYVIDKLQKDGFKKGDNLAISWLGHFDDDESLEKRRLLLEELLSRSNSPQTHYHILMGLMNIDDPKSLEIVKKLHQEDKYGKILFHMSQQLINRLEKKDG